MASAWRRRRRRRMFYLPCHWRQRREEETNAPNLKIKRKENELCNSLARRLIETCAE